LDAAVELCAKYADVLSEKMVEKSRLGEVLRVAFARVEEAANESLSRAKEENPLAFLQPSYEQALKLNCWIWGYSFICDFDANRIGKTAGAVFNGTLWVFPNDPTWKMFQVGYSEEWDEPIQVFQRPPILQFLMLQDFYEEHPDLIGDPTKPWYDVPSGNREKYCKVAKVFPRFMPQPLSSSDNLAAQPAYPAFPEPSYTGKENTLWIGAPDFDYHREIILPEWRKWLPKPAIVRDSDHDVCIDLRVNYRTRLGAQRFCNWSIQGKSYEAKDTKWSGAAVKGIVLTEGLTIEILSEIRQRFQADAFASWDYTPYEPRNTGKKSALAHKVYQRKEELPLRFHVFSGFGIERAPSYILPTRKKNDLIRMWEGKPEGEARIKGRFFSSSPVALSNLDREFHTLDWSVEELFERYPSHILMRSMDLGYDHPTVCWWYMIAPDNSLFFYRRFAKAGLSIGERCRAVVELSNNKLYQHRYGPGADDYYCVEYHPNPNSEVPLFTVVDFHLFKTDEINKRPYCQNYFKEGLIIRPSSTMRPKDRANECNRQLERSQFRVHPQTKQTPGARIYFLLNGEGVHEGLENLENLFWARFAQGSRKGEPKDELQDHDDDDFDAFSYGVTSPLAYSRSLRPKRIDTPPFASLQNNPEEYYAAQRSAQTQFAH